MDPVFGGEGAESGGVDFAGELVIDVGFAGGIAAGERLGEIGDAADVVHIEVAGHGVAGRIDGLVAEVHLFTVKRDPVGLRQVAFGKRRSLAHKDLAGEGVVGERCCGGDRLSGAGFGEVAVGALGHVVGV